MIKLCMFCLYQVTFSPLSGGSYEAVVAVYAHLVVSSSMESNKPVANVILKGIAEEPQIEIQTTSSGPGNYSQCNETRCSPDYIINILIKGAVLISVYIIIAETKQKCLFWRHPIVSGFALKRNSTV